MDDFPDDLYDALEELDRMAPNADTVERRLDLISALSRSSVALAKYRKQRHRVVARGTGAA